MRLLIISILIIFCGCNPVKKVLKDRSKLDVVAKEVIRMGYCVNDTVVIVKTKDSVIYKDSIVEKIVNVPCKDFDTTIGGSRISIVSGVLTFTRKDSIVYKTKTVTNTVTDRAKENLLKEDIILRDSAIISLGNEIDNLGKINDEVESKMKAWKFRFFGLIFLLIAFDFLRRIIKTKINGII